MTKARPKKPEPAATWEEIGALVPWDANPRINDHAVQEVADSIKRFGFSSPIIARREDGVVIAGHTRLKAAQSLGLDKVPVRYLDLDPADAKLLALADNKVGEVASWDDIALASVISELRDGGVDVSASGFGELEIDALLGEWSGLGPVGDDLDEIHDEGVARISITVSNTDAVAAHRTIEAAMAEAGIEYKLTSA